MVLLILTLGLFSMSVGQFMTGDSRSGLVFFAFFLLVGSVGGLGALTRFPGSRIDLGGLEVGTQDSLGETGLIVPYRRSLAVGYVIVPVTFSMMLTSLAIGLAFGLWGEWDAGRSVSPGALVLLLSCAIAAVYALWTVTQILRGRLARGHLALTPHGVRHRSWAFDSFFEWDGILVVRAGEADGPLIEMAVRGPGDSSFTLKSRIWKQEELSFAPHMAVRGKVLSIDPALVYWALRYYHEHPEARFELADSRGVNRLRAGAVV